MEGVLWQLKMIVGMRTQKSRMTTMLQRRIIACGGGEDREGRQPLGCAAPSNNKI